MVGRDRDETLSVLRWSARILGTAIFLIFVFRIILGQIPPIWNQPIEVQVAFIGVFLFLLGCLAGWNRDGLAAFMILMGYLIFKLVEGKGFWPPTTMELVLLAGILYFASWWKSAVDVKKA